jgi:hypothetical protein
LGFSFGHHHLSHCAQSALGSGATQQYRQAAGAITQSLTGAAAPDDEVQSYVTNGANHFEIDLAFCARMRAAIKAGLESAPDGMITMPGTRKPKYVPTQNQMIRFSPRNDGF